MEFHPNIKCYSDNSQKYFYPTKTSEQSLLAKDKPYPCEALNLYEILERCKKYANIKKEYRPTIQMFNLDYFAKQANAEIKNWNGCIFIDFDLQNSKLLNKAVEKNPEAFDLFSNKIWEMCIDMFNDNFLFFEKSSSGGIHLIFYYDVEKTLENRDIVAEYTKNIILGSVENYILKGKDILLESDSNGSKAVFDPIYKRPFQRCYVTGLEASINEECTGFFDTSNAQSLINKVKAGKVIYELNRISDIKTTYHDITYKPVNEKFEVSHNERFSDYAALIELYKAKEVADQVWAQLVRKNIIPDKGDTIEYLISQPTREHWYKYNRNPQRLKRYGFNYSYTNQIKTDYSTTGKGHEIKTYLSEEYMDLIHETMEHNNVLTIVGNTGIGKTETIKKLLLETNGVVLVPFNSLRNMYIIKEDFVDYNAQSMGLLFEDEFYKSRDLVNIIGENIDKNGNITYTKYNKELANCMVYDQLMNIKDEELYGKTIFIDESHILFIQQDFRTKLVKVIQKLNRIKEHCKIVLISATPLKELEILGSSEILYFWKTRPIINTKIVKVSNAKYYMMKWLDEFKKSENYNRIILFSDISARALYDNARLNEGVDVDKNISILHTYFWEKGNPENKCEQIITSETLDTKIVIGTSLVYNGLNFQNKGEHNLVIIDFIEGKDNVWKIIQAAGRLRNSTCDLIILYQPAKPSKISQLEKLGQERLLADKMSEIDLPKGVFKVNTKLTEEDYYEALEDLIKFTQEFSNIDVVTHTLDDWGYFNWEIVDKEDIKVSSITNELRRKINGMIIDLFVNSNSNEIEQKIKEKCKEDFIGVDYFKSEIGRLRRFLDRWDINIKYFGSLLKVGAKSTGSIINDLDNIFKLSLINRIEWEKICREIKSNWKDLDEILVKRQFSEINKANEIIGLYSDKIIDCKLLKAVKGNESFCKYGIVKKYGEECYKKAVKINDERSKAGSKKGKNEKKIQDIETGIVYNSINDAVEQTGKGRATISRWLKGGKFIYL